MSKEADDVICGETMDHDIKPDDWDCSDGMCVAVCRRCGAELWDD